MMMFKKYSTFVCVGSGGVGKTTVSASLAVLAARQGFKVLVLTIDPAKRLATSLGIQRSMSHPVKVDLEAKGELSALIIDPQLEFDEFIKSSAHKSSRIFKNVLYKQLSTTLSGSQEFTSMIRLLSEVESHNYDIVILDTPPAQNAKDFLAAPKKIYSLFDSTIINWFLSSERSQKGFMSKVLYMGTHKVLKAFERITGGEFIQQLQDFFESIEGLKEKISQKSHATHELLVSPKTAFILVTGFDKSKLSEAEQFAENLRADDYHLTHVVVNRSFPLWWKNNSSTIGSSKENEGANQLLSYQDEELNQCYQEFCDYFTVREHNYQKLEAKIKKDIDMVKLPEMSEDICGVSDLTRFSELLEGELK